MSETPIWLPLGAGAVAIDPATGAPLQFRHPATPRRRFLLDEAEVDWHTPEHAWGTGLYIGTALETGMALGDGSHGSRAADHHASTDRHAPRRDSARWCTPSEVEMGRAPIDSAVIDSGAARVVQRFVVTEQVRLQVERSFGETMVERYTWRNVGPHTLVVGSLGVCLPFADRYTTARESLDCFVNAHVFAGGAAAWVLAQPMDGSWPCLAVRVRRGAFDAYSIESRNDWLSSNNRGHLIMQVTDAARNPGAFGGLEPLEIAPGQSYELELEVGWVEANDLATWPGMGADGLGTLAQLTAEVGDELAVRGASEVRVRGGAARVAAVAGGHVLRATAPGLVDLAIELPAEQAPGHAAEKAAGQAAPTQLRTQVLFHLPLAEVVRRRVGYIVERQRASERPGLRAHALVACDTATGLRQGDNGWPDWSDGAERTGMALLVQLAALRGLVDPQAVEEVLAGWAAFARAHLLDETLAPRRGSTVRNVPLRLYDAPWLTRFYADRHELLAARGTDPDGARAALETAMGILERAHELGIAHHLGIEYSPACRQVAGLLRTAAREQEARGDRASGAAGRARAQQLEDGVVASARHFLALGRDLPAHEVNYEQSMVAPLVTLLIDAFELTGDETFAAGALERLDWLLAFGGPQPHVRLRDIGIRHWDGFWFGLNRMWGDVFPHYWSVLTADALLRLPPPFATEHHRRTADAILHANLVNQYPDGSATCAFVMPSAVDGRPAHAGDPLANDQDWHLAIWLRHLPKL